MRKVFDLMDGGSSAQEGEPSSALSFESVRSFMADYLGFGHAEAEKFFELGDGVANGGVSFQAFASIFPRLNPFNLGPGPKEEVFFRKAGSLGGFHKKYTNQQCQLDTLEDCEAYVCTPTAQVFADECKRCMFMLGPVESSFFIRDCEDCIVWVACQQLRTRNCKRCKFFLYCKSDPVIESSEDLAFAPWAASYPGCSKHFEMLKFDPQKNHWNAIFDFTGKGDAANWRILSLDEVCELRVDLCEDVPWAGGHDPENPVPKVTHAMLCADPLSSEDCGQGIANIPQCRPALPPAPSKCKVASIQACDDAQPQQSIGFQRFMDLKL